MRRLNNNIDYTGNVRRIDMHKQNIQPKLQTEPRKLNMIMDIGFDIDQNRSMDG